MFTIDGMTWPYPCDISRNADVRSSDVSGEMLDGSYYNDVLGTYMSYTVKMAVPLNQRDLASAYFETASAPVEGHTCVFPYNQGTVIIAARIENVSDVFVRLPNGAQYWKGLQFTVVANHATRALSGAEIIARGRALMPEVAEHNEGDVYVWENGAWVLTTDIQDGNLIRY